MELNPRRASAPDGYLQDDQTLGRFRAGALAQAARFDIEVMIPKYESYYREVIESSKVTSAEPVQDC